MRLLPVSAHDARLCKSLSFCSATVHYLRAGETENDNVSRVCAAKAGASTRFPVLFALLWRIVAKLDLFTCLQIWQQSRETSVLAISRTEGLIA
jgi:hypothetical protein